MKKLTNILFIIYLILLIWLVLFKFSFQINELEHIRNINLIPFYYSSESSIHLREVVENILIFIPLGIYLKMKSISCKKIIIYGLSLSLMLEVIQYITGLGATDITDIITNTLGTMLGIIMYQFINLLFKEKTNKIINILALIVTIAFIALLILLTLVNL